MNTRLLLTTALILAAPTLHADEDLINPDRPGIADGSQTVGRRAFQVEVGVERDRTDIDGGQDVSLLTPLLLRYGISSRWELRVETAGFGHETVTVHDLDQSTSGLRPLSIGFKYHLLDEDTKTHRPSLGFIGRLFPPSGSNEFKSDHTVADLRLAADMTLGDHWAVNPNLGVLSGDDGDGRYTAFTAALTLQYNLSDHFNVFVDGALQAPEQKSGGGAVLIDTGAAWILGRNTQLDFSIGWGPHGDRVPDVFWSAGYSRRF